MKPKILSSFATSILLATALTATAATFTWDGGGADANSATAQNWVGDAAVVPNSDVIFGLAGISGTTINWTSGNIFSSTFASGASAYTMTNAGGFQFNQANTGTIVNSSSNTQTFTSDIRVFFNGTKTFTAATADLSLSNVQFRGDTMVSGQTNTLALNGASNGTIAGSITNSSVPIGAFTAITKAGAGTWTLGGANTSSAPIAISGGVLKVGTATSLGFGALQTSVDASTSVTSTGTLDLNGVSNVLEKISLNGTGFGANGGLINSSATAASITSGVTGMTAPVTGIAGVVYSTVPTVAFVGGGGTGATATATLGLTAASFSITSAGTGWVVGNTFNITGGGGTGAVGLVTSVSAGAITGYSIATPGGGYTTAPTTITKVGAVVAGATATITGNATNFAATGFTVTNAGSGYTSTPTVTLAGVSQAPTVSTSGVVMAGNSSIGGNGDITIAPVVSGAFNLTKVGAGVLTLSGANTYSGKTIISGGVIRVQNSGALGTSTVAEAQSTSIESGAALEIDGSLTTTEFIRVTGTGIGGNGAIRATTGTSNLNSQIAMEGTGGVTVSFGVDSGATLKVSRLYSDPGRDTNFEKVGAGTLVLKADNSDDYVGNTTITGGTLQVGDGSTTGELKSTGVTNNSNLSFNRTNAYDYTGAIDGSGTLTQAGSGTLTLSGANSYAGTTTISAGTLRIGAGGTTGTLGGGSVTNNAILEFSRSNAMTVTNAISGTGTIYQTGAGTTTLDPGAGSHSIRAISANGGNLTLKSGTFATTGSDPFNGAYTVGAGARGGTLTIDGATLNVGGGRALKVGANANGNLEIKSGTVTADDLVLGHNGISVGTQSGGDVTVTNLYHQDGGNGSSYTLSGGSLTAERIYNYTASVNDFTLNLNGGTLHSAAGTTNLIDDGGRGGAEITVLLGTGNTVIDTTSSSATIVRAMGDMPSVAGGFTKDGSNSLTLTGDSTYTGATTVSAGALLVNGDNSSATGAVNVSSTATLGGDGTLGGALTLAAGATLAPGATSASAGNLTAAAGVSLAGIYEWDLAAPATSGPGTNFDTLTITGGDAIITGASLLLNLGGNAPTAVPFWQTDQTWAGILNNTGLGSLTGAFTITNDQSSWSSLGSFTTTISGGSNDVNLVWSAVPEPSNMALVGGLGLLGILRRRRDKSLR